jgi:hypothetical protein
VTVRGAGRFPSRGHKRAIWPSLAFFWGLLSIDVEFLSPEEEDAEDQRRESIGPLCMGPLPNGSRRSRGDFGQAAAGSRCHCVGCELSGGN